VPQWACVVVCEDAGEQGNDPQCWCGECFVYVTRAIEIEG
jgi:hypothetical protein